MGRSYRAESNQYLEDSEGLWCWALGLQVNELAAFVLHDDGSFRRWWRLAVYVFATCGGRLKIVVVVGGGYAEN